MNWKRKYLSFALVTILCISGVLTGCNKEEAKPKTTEKSDATTVSEQIAVVNEDTGVEYPSGTVNYSDEFIGTLNDDVYVVTSSVEAEEGLKDGTFAGLLIFPENLSYSILNINYGNPQKIELGYSISEVADKEISDEAHNRIINSYQKFNDRLSYAYINALMEEIENGQNEVGKIFGNDAGILEAAEKFSNGEYDSEYKNPDLPNNTLDYSEHNTDDYRDKGINYANEVEDLYGDAYKSAYDEQTKVQGNIPDGQSVKKAADRMIELHSMVQSYNSELTSFADNELAPYNQIVEDYIRSVKTYMDTVEGYIAQVEGYKNLVDANIGELDPSVKTDIYNAGATIISAGNNIKSDAVKPDSGKAQDVPAFSPGAGIVLPAEADFSTALSNFEAKTSALYTATKNLSENLKPENMINTAMTGSDPKQTYKQKVEEKKRNFSDTATETTKRFNEIQRGNIEKLTDSYEKNNKYMTDTVDALNKKSETDREELKKGIESFFRTAKGNSADTKRRLEAFRNMLSRAKVDGRISSSVMEFLIQPIQLEEYISN